jgi:hypothetical protein
MPTTGTLAPSLKQDAETRITFTAILKLLLASALSHTPGMKKQFIDQMVIENNKNAEADFNLALGLENSPSPISLIPITDG